MTEKIYNVLFLCTGNSARSIFAESLINRFGRGKFRGFSAGSHPRGEVNPFTILELKRNNYIVDDLRSKDWSEFSAEDAPEMDFVFTVCDKAAAEMCPVWPGQPMTAHWGIKDPAAVEGSEIEKKAAFVKAFNELQNRISIFVNLPITSLDKLKLQEQLDLIGNSTPKTSKDTAA
ncbi:MAG: arsenate reductase ArsC [Candidatus Thiodiazotropha taylori]|uniref:Arsenate reductase ArsC n=1 Tax=Candidatus Thiodiazotropha taylori TaxID=2792791 RepID=A0A9E4P5C5_9GAMM|nr:arsenate reductase ArsC [Candidatus Thiodiazotropha taylori]MCG8028386.1 arsenate reductase ArsC [Candidatus Thiodiazotropha taylori]MCG8049906.1 arsenate reductase ArsC [Candidatus Thiodiazotropha taylori]MCG8079624.1 arsenate reductase ArsC [Candidatus Thiodiazotropha taylori]MCG8107816.1 arsenate reductase ArsC [Candidatus Thiodiazotropha taylori]